MQKTKYFIIILALFLVGLPFIAKPQPIKIAGQEREVKGTKVVPSPTPEPTKSPQIIYVQPQVYIGTTPVPTQKPAQNVTNVTNVYGPTPILTDAPTVAPTQIPSPTPVSDSITVKAGNDTWTTNLVPSETAFDALKRAVGSGLTYDTYDCCGAFITGFNGTPAVYPQWWEFLINGTSSSVGVSSYIPVNGDILEFKFHNE